MPSERVQRVIDGYLDEIEVAAKDGRWNDVIELANTILELDDTNHDAQTFLKLAVSKSGSQETHSVNESITKNQPIQELNTDQEKLNLDRSSLTGSVDIGAQRLRLLTESSFQEPSAVFVRRIINPLLQSSDQQLIDIVAENLKLIEDAPKPGSGILAKFLLFFGFFGSGIPDGTYTRLRLAHLLILLRKQNTPEGSEALSDNESQLNSLAKRCLQVSV